MRLDEYRKQRGLSCEQAAAQLGVDESTFNRWERGETVPGGINLMRLVQWSAGSVNSDDILAVAEEVRAKKAAATKAVVAAVTGPGLTADQARGGK
jgi:transcriptional regulator with XRE-family HTH domain